MSVQLKFIRRFGRPRRSDRRIALWAVLTAVAAHLVFWSLFSYRRPVSAVHRHGAPVSLLNRSKISPELALWLEYHDPSNMIRSDFGGGYAAQLPNTAGIVTPAAHVELPLPEPAPKIRPFRELPMGKTPSGARLPTVAASSAVVSSDRTAPVTDGGGRALPFDASALPYRTAKVNEDTVLRVQKIGGMVTFAVHSSCGDAELDRAATGLPAERLAGVEPFPQYIVVRWPEKPGNGGKRP